MSDLTKVKIWKVLTASNHFWIVTLVLYFQSRGLSLSQALQTMSIYSILVVVLEYPTGVIGDFFSHKTSVLLGNIVATISFAIVILPGSFYYYIFVFALFALAISLTSGSDTALLHSVSKNFKKDLSEITPYALILSTINITLGGLAALIDIRFPLLLSFLYTLPGFYLVLSLKNYSYKKEEGNIFATALNGLKDVASNSKLKNLFIVSSVFGAFFLSVKWFYNPLFEKISIPVAYWGIIASVGFLLVALGAFVYKKNDSVSLILTSVISLFAILIFGATSHWALPIIGIWLIHIFRGYQDTHLGVEINEAITTTRRASILSFNSLTTRLLSAIYISGAGILLGKTSFFIVSVVTVILIGVFAAFPLMKLHRTK